MVEIMFEEFCEALAALQNEIDECIGLCSIGIQLPGLMHLPVHISILAL